MLLKDNQWLYNIFRHVSYPHLCIDILHIGLYSNDIQPEMVTRAFCKYECNSNSPVKQIP